MILDKRDDLAAFRQAVRAWLAKTVPADWPSRLSEDDDKAFTDLQRWWMAERAKVGLATPHWPSEYGGADLTLAHQIIMAEESARANAPPLAYYVVSLNHIPATLIPWGTDYQKKRYLPTVAAGTIWCQGFSEPNSGSDLASLQTKAVRDGDHYIVNGQKIWSSFSMHADYCILLTRTDFEARKQQGITYFVLDMRAPGVEVRPIKQAAGRTEFSEIFLNDVRIPIEDRVGEENQGWTVTQSTLAAERGVLAFEGAERQRYVIERFYRDALENDAAWLKDDALRREFMAIFSELQAGRRLIRKLLKDNQNPDAPPSMLPAYIKISGTTLSRRFWDFRTRIADIDGQMLGAARADNAMAEYLSHFGGMIAAGTNEVMRNLIAERGLGMPR